MAKQRLTSEEQSLELIEKGGDIKTTNFKRKRKFFLSFGNFLRFEASFKRAIGRSAAKLKANIREPNLKVLNKIFLTICIVSIGYSIRNFISKRPDIDKVYEKAKSTKYKELEEKPAIKPRPFSHYLKMVQRRNIFTPVVLKDSGIPGGQKEIPKMAKDLKLVGISWDKKPIVMIEDKKAQKTYFLKKGDTIKEFKIDEILKDRVILSYEGQKVELM